MAEAVGPVVPSMPSTACSVTLVVTVSWVLGLASALSASTSAWSRAASASRTPTRYSFSPEVVLEAMVRSRSAFCSTQTLDPAAGSLHVLVADGFGISHLLLPPR